MLIFSTAVHSSRARAVAPQKGIQATEIEQALAKQTTRQRRKVHKNYDYCFSIYWIYSRDWIFRVKERLLLAQWKMDMLCKNVEKWKFFKKSLRPPAWLDPALRRLTTGNWLRVREKEIFRQYLIFLPFVPIHRVQLYWVLSFISEKLNSLLAVS